MTAPAVDRVVVVHGPAEPLLTYILELVGLAVAREIGEVTVWAPNPPATSVGVALSSPPPPLKESS
jgi:hypothetical protein